MEKRPRQANPRKIILKLLKINNWRQKVSVERILENCGREVLTQINCGGEGGEEDYPK
jgi:hypothetical protein